MHRAVLLGNRKLSSYREFAGKISFWEKNTSRCDLEIWPKCSENWLKTTTNKNTEKLSHKIPFLFVLFMTTATTNCRVFGTCCSIFLVATFKAPLLMQL